MKSKNAERGFVASVLIGADIGNPEFAKYRAMGVEESWFSDHVARKMFRAIEACDKSSPGSYTTSLCMSKAEELGLAITLPELEAVRYSEATAAWGMEHFRSLERAAHCREQVAHVRTFYDNYVRDGYSVSSFEKGLGSLLEMMHATKNKRNRVKDTGIKEAVEQYEKSLADDKNAVVKTHLFDLNDALNGGLRGGQLIVVAGRPGMGKSAFAMEIAEYGCGMDAGLYYSLEMSLQDFGERLLHRNEGDLKKVHSYASRHGLILRTTGAWTIERIRDDALGVASRLKEQGKPLRLVAVDHIGLVTPSLGHHKRTREQEVAHISRSLKTLAGELDCPVVAVSQLNRGLEHRQEKGPVLSDLRDSGAIEQDADIVLGLHRPSYYDENMKYCVDEIRCLKVRQGRTGTIGANFVPERVCWRSA